MRTEKIKIWAFKELIRRTFHKISKDLFDYSISLNYGSAGVVQW